MVRQKMDELKQSQDQSNDAISSNSWEVEFLANYCNVDIEALSKINIISELRSVCHYCKQNEESYCSGSVFASSLYIASLCPGLHLLGNNVEEEMEIREWVEFYCSQLRQPLPWQRTSKECLHTCIDALDRNLSERVFMTGSGMRCTVADIILYYGLYGYMRESSYTDKLSHPHVNRWFDQMQHSKNIKPFTWQWVAFPRIIHN